MADVIRGFWEYRFISLSTINSEDTEPFSVAKGQLNQLGEEGWEVVALLEKESKHESFFLALLKRPLAKPN